MSTFCEKDQKVKVILGISFTKAYREINILLIFFLIFALWNMSAMLYFVAIYKMSAFIVMIFLIPCAFGDECEVIADPDVFNNTVWQVFFEIYRTNLNKSYANEEQEQRCSTMLGNKMKKLSENIVNFFNFKKFLNGTPLVSFQYSHQISLLLITRHWSQYKFLKSIIEIRGMQNNVPSFQRTGRLFSKKDGFKSKSCCFSLSFESKIPKIHSMLHGMSFEGKIKGETEILMA